MKFEKSIVILSGGVDSTTLLYDVVNKEKPMNVIAISFDYHQKHGKELEHAKKTCDKLKVAHIVADLGILNKLAPSALTRVDIDIPDGNYDKKNMKATVVPNRNMVMISLAVSFAIGIKAKHVYYGAHGGDHALYPDCRKEFIKAMEKAIKLCDWDEIKLHAPFINLTKEQIIMHGKKLKVDYHLTWSCYKGKEKACGKCGTCKERLASFKKNNMFDPIEYDYMPRSLRPNKRLLERWEIMNLQRENKKLEKKVEYLEQSLEHANEKHTERIGDKE